MLYSYKKTIYAITLISSTLLLSFTAQPAAAPYTESQDAIKTLTEKVGTCKLALEKHLNDLPKIANELETAIQKITAINNKLSTLDDEGLADEIDGISVTFTTAKFGKEEE